MLFARVFVYSSILRNINFLKYVRPTFKKTTEVKVLIMLYLLYFSDSRQLQHFVNVSETSTFSICCVALYNDSI